MYDHPSIGFIGFGEAGYEVAKGLHSEGITRILLCHLRKTDPDRIALVKTRAQEAGGQYKESAKEVIENSDIILSVVPPSAAVSAAQEAAAHLKAGQTYVDLSSSFPDNMVDIASLVKPTGAEFTDGAMMSPVPMYGHKVLTYLAGPQAETVAQQLNRFGMNLKSVGKEPGQASAIKLILSIATKGFSSLLVEMFLAAHYYDVEEPVISALEQFYAKGLRTYIDRGVGSSAIFAGRRVTEMESSIRLLKKIGVDPIMTESTVKILEWFAAQNLTEYFGGITPKGYKEVIKAWEDTGVFDKLFKKT